MLTLSYHGRIPHSETDAAAAAIGATLDLDPFLLPMTYPPSLSSTLSDPSVSDQMIPAHDDLDPGFDGSRFASLGFDFDDSAFAGGGHSSTPQDR